MTISSAPAVFLDLDGTLVDIVARPDLTHVAPELIRKLEQLYEALQGALAIVSGRPISELDRLLQPLILPAAGVHGIEHRQDRGSIEIRCQKTIPDDIRRQIVALADSDSRLLLEDKQFSFSLHYREAPELESMLRERFMAICANLGPLFSVQNGKMVFELRPSGIDKGAAIEKFMAETPFAGRTAVFIGDDVTDEDAFKVVNRLRGHSARVGSPKIATAARYNLADVAAVHGWLNALT